MINQKHNLIVWIFWGYISDSQVFNQSQTCMGQFQMLFGPLEFQLRFSLSFLSPFFRFYFCLCLFWSFVPLSWSSHPFCSLSARVFVFSCLFVCKVLKKERKKKKKENLWHESSFFHFLITYFSSYSFLSYDLLFISFFLITYLTSHSFLSYYLLFISVGTFLILTFHLILSFVNTYVSSHSFLSCYFLVISFVHFFLLSCHLILFFLNTVF